MADCTRGNVSCNQLSFSNYVLGRVEYYDTAKENVISFHKVDDIVQGIECRLSNMAGGFPFEFEGRVWDNSEVLYLCGEFSNNTDEHKTIQERLTQSKSGYAAKRFVKTPCKKSVRKDFEAFRLQWMLFVVWQKCLGNEDFRKLLLSTKEAVLVEDTTSDNQGSAEIWGGQNKELRALRNAALPQIETAAQALYKSKKERERYINIEYNKIQAGVFVGQNNIGKILMMCRLALTNGIEPPIDYALLSQFEVFLFGKRIDFNKYAPKADSEAKKQNEKVSNYELNLIKTLNLVLQRYTEDPDFRFHLKRFRGVNDMAKISAMCGRGMSLGFEVAPHCSLLTTTDEFILYRKILLKDTPRMSEEETAIIGLILDIDYNADEMNNLLPMAIARCHKSIWEKLKEENRVLYERLGDRIDKYIKSRQNDNAEDVAWRHIAETADDNQRKRLALKQLIYELYTKNKENGRE